MKKILALLLVAVMCLYLVACGSGVNESTQPQSDGEKNNVTNSTTENIESDFANHPLLTKLYGTWENKSDNEYAPCQTLIINEDGSCIVDGVEATWDVERPYNPNSTSSLVIDIFIDGERNFGAILFDNGTIVGQTPNYGTGGWYFNTSNYITVEITPENWSEYFELVESTEYITDEFGDFLYVEKAWNLVLKNGYQFLSEKNYEISFEFQYSKYSVNCEINHDTKEVTSIGEPQNITEHTEKASFDDSLCITIWKELIFDTSTLQVCISDFQILRVAGDTIIDLEIEAE